MLLPFTVVVAVLLQIICEPGAKILGGLGMMPTPLACRLISVLTGWFAWSAPGKSCVIWSQSNSHATSAVLALLELEARLKSSVGSDKPHAVLKAADRCAGFADVRV